MANQSAFGSGGPAAPYLNTMGKTNIYPYEDASPSVPPRETCALGVVLQTTTTERTVCLLTAAMLMLQGGANVPQGLLGQ